MGTTARDIGIAAGVAIGVIAIAATAGGLALVHRAAQEELGQSLEATLRAQVYVFKLLVTQREMNALYAARQPALLTAARAASFRRVGGRAAAAGEVLESFLDLGFNALALHDAAGRTIAQRGEFTAAPAMHVTLDTVHHPDFLAGDGVHMRVRLPLRGAEGEAGTLVVEQPLLLLQRILLESDARGSAGRTRLCGIAGSSVACVPPGAPPNDAASPMGRALRGESGHVRVARSGGGQDVVAFAPVGALGLGMTIAADSSEVLGPMRNQLPYAATLLAALVLAGAGLIHMMVRPIEVRLDAAVGAQRRANQQLTAITENAPVLIGYIDAAGRFGFNNRTYEDWLGLGRERITGRLVREVLGDAAFARFKPFVERALAGERVEFETELLRGDHARHVQGVYVPDVAPDGRVQGLYGIVTDITRLKLAERELRKLSETDALTGTASRRVFDDRLGQALARAGRGGAPFALVYLDIDHFKSINDRRGHAAGDALLVQFAARLVKSVRGCDTVARLGGDEFAILLESAGDHERASLVAAKILQRVRAPFEAGGSPVDVTTSIGATVSGYGGETAASLLARADRALYRAKAAGRDTFRLG